MPPAESADPATPPAGPPTAQTTLAILLGASEWPEYKTLGSSTSYRNSATDLKAYLLAPDGMNLDDDNVLDLFDDGRPASVINRRMAQFLRDRTVALSHKKTPARDLLTIYIGHGGFVGNDNDAYFLALRSTEQYAEGASGLRVSDLAQTILNNAPHLRRYLIFDCCFAASAYRSFQSAPLEVARTKTFDVFPRRGTALLCSSGSRDPSKVPPGCRYTMFSEALLHVLKQGSEFYARSQWLSLSDLGDAIRDEILSKYPNDAARAEVHSPNQRQGDVAAVPLFPNALAATSTDAVIRLCRSALDHGDAALAVDGITAMRETAVSPLLQIIETDLSLRTIAAEALVGLAETDSVALAMLPNVFDFLDARQQAAAARVATTHAAVSPAFARLFGLALHDSDPATREGAARRFASIGELAIPLLRQELLSGDTRSKESAATALRAMGATAAPVVNELLQAFQKESGATRLRTAEAFMRIAAETIVPDEVLVEALQTADPDVRSRATQMLTAKGDEAIPFLYSHSSDSRSLEEGVRILKATGQHAVLQLCTFVQSQPSVRTIAIEALVSLAAGHSQVLEVVVPFIDTLDSGPRQTAARAAVYDESRNPALVPLLIAALSDRDFRIAAEAVRRLAAIGSPAVPVLREKLLDQDDAIVASAVLSLGVMGDAARPAVPDLLQAFRQKSERVRMAVAEALLSIGGSDIPLDVLEQALNSEVSGIRVVALAGLEGLGAPGTVALCRALAHSRALGDILAVLRLKTVKFSDAAIVELVRSLGDLLRRNSRVFEDHVLYSGNDSFKAVNPHVFLIRDLAADTLSNCGDECVAGVASLLSFPDSRGRVARWALRSSGRVSHAIDVLAGRVALAQTSVASVIALEMLGPQAVPALRAAKTNASAEEARGRAERALRKLEPKFIGGGKLVRNLLLFITPVIGPLLIPSGLIRIWPEKRILLATGVFGAVLGAVVAVPVVLLGFANSWLRALLWSVGCGAVVVPALRAATVGALLVAERLMELRDLPARLNLFGTMVIAITVSLIPSAIGAALLFRPKWWFVTVIGIGGAILGSMLGLVDGGAIYDDEPST